MLHHVMVGPVHRMWVWWLVWRFLSRFRIVSFVRITRTGCRGRHRHAIGNHVGVVHLIAIYHHAGVTLHVGIVGHSTSLRAHFVGHVGRGTIRVGWTLHWHFLHGDSPVLHNCCRVYVGMRVGWHCGWMVGLFSTIFCWYGWLWRWIVSCCFLASRDWIGFVFVRLGFLVANCRHISIVLIFASVLALCFFLLFLLMPSFDPIPEHPVLDGLA